MVSMAVTERRGAKLNRKKTVGIIVYEYKQEQGIPSLELQGEDVSEIEEFKYMGSTIQ